MNSKLDQRDRKLLNLLQGDGKMTHQQLADKTGLSAAACWRRVKTLEQDRVIESYRAVVDRKKLGYELSVFVYVTLDRHSSEHAQEFRQAVKKNTAVLQCHAITGDADYLLLVASPDIQSYNRFLQEFLFGLKGIAHVRSNFVLEAIKSDDVLTL